MQGAARRRTLRRMAEEEDAGQTRIRHPNREKASSQVAKSFVGLLLLVSAALVAIISLGGWSALQGAYVLSAMYFATAWWNRPQSQSLPKKPRAPTAPECSIVRTPALPWRRCASWLNVK